VTFAIKYSLVGSAKLFIKMRGTVLTHSKKWGHAHLSSPIYDAGGYVVVASPVTLPGIYRQIPRRWPRISICHSSAVTQARYCVVVNPAA